MYGIPNEIITEIGGSTAYPIFSFSLEWEQDASDDPACGRERNSCGGMYQMFREMPAVKILECHIDKLKKNRREPAIRWLNESIQFLRFDTWCIEWFSHQTFDDGRSNEEFMDSFDDFVCRCRRDGIELMGAEDRWRWTTPDDCDDKTLPCRCEGCKKLGVVRVNH